MRTFVILFAVVAVMVSACSGPDDELGAEVEALQAEVANLRDDREGLLSQIASLESDVSGLTIERDGLLGETEQLLSQLAAVEEQRFLRSMTRVLTELSEAVVRAQEPLLGEVTFDVDAPLVGQDLYVAALHLINDYNEISIQLQALSGPPSVQPIRDPALEIAVLTDDEIKAILDAVGRTSVVDTVFEMAPSAPLANTVASTLRLIEDF